MGRKTTRRSKGQLEKEIMEALERLVTTRGFMNIPMLALTKEADIDFSLLYRHYGTKDQLYEKFVSRYNFWPNDKLNLSDIPRLGDRKFYAESLKTIFTELEKNSVVQKLLLWELEEDNPITRNTANMRGKLSLNLMAYYGEKFNASGIDINSLSALFTAGIFFLVLRRDRSPFYSIDFTSAEGRKRFFDSIDTLTDILFNKLEEKHRQEETIRKMRADGISMTKIADYLGLSLYQLRIITGDLSDQWLQTD